MQVEYVQVYHGPNRHAECTLVEQVVSCNAETAARIVKARAELAQYIAGYAADGQDRTSGDPAGNFMQAMMAFSGSPVEVAARCYARIALHLQSVGGHPVSWARVEVQSCGTAFRVWYEFDDHEVALKAGEVALQLLLQGPVGDGVDTPRDPIASPGASTPNPRASIDEFIALARSRALPRDTMTLIEIARSMDIPHMKGDRYPFKALNSKRIRRNGGLRLGYGDRQHVLDGTLCFDLYANALRVMSDRESCYRFLETLGGSTPTRAPNSEHCNSLLRARRCAAALGYPVVVRPQSIVPGLRPTAVSSERALEEAVRAAQKHGPGIVVERWPAGDIHHLIVANRRLYAIVTDAAVEGRSRCVRVSSLEAGVLHPEYRRIAEEAAARLGVGLLVLTVACRDLSADPAQGGSCIGDLTVSPEVDHLVDDPLLHREIMTEFVRWLFPEGRNGRIPIVAVTGTNGKTTTTRMIHNIIAAAGKSVGMACTDGLFIRGERLRQGDSSGFEFHHGILQDFRVSHAVLETARGAVAQRGFAFDACDVGVCTNVTADHLGQFGIDTVEQMAELKYSIIRRARRGVALNADDRFCLDMGNRLPGRSICWTSRTKSLPELLSHADNGMARSFVVLEEQDGRDWLVRYAEGGVARQVIVAVEEIPAAFGGSALHNVENALLAVGASDLLGVPLDAIRSALRGFTASYENAPGRLNVIFDRPFTAMIDYAHNPDGYRVLVDFMDRQRPAGSKILMVGCPGRSSPEAIGQIADQIAGHFDHYVCRDSRVPEHYEPGELPELVRRCLVERGVPAGSVDVVCDQGEAVAASLDLARAGDFVVLCTTSSFRDRAREQILEHFAGLGESEAKAF